MFIIKNAWRSISRSKGRNALIVLIVAIISIAATIGLSIRNTADETRAEGLANTSVTGSISLDRTKLLSKASSSSSTDSNRESMRSALDKSSLTLAQYQKYATSSTAVSSTYYSEQSYLGKTSSFQPVETTSENANNNKSTDSNNGQQGGPNGQGEQEATKSSYSTDFTITGFSDDTAVSKANSGNYKITSGKMFTSTSKNEVVISNTLASFNNVKVGDTITLTSPVSGSTKTYTFTIVGIYKNTSSTTTQGGPGNQTSSDNAIYTSMTTLTSIGLDSTTLAKADGTTTPKTSLTYTYVFRNESAYNQFVKDVKSAGLSSDYTVSSTDVENYEASLVPLNNLSSFALTLLLIVLGVGAGVLVVINLFNIRERKYEIGVLTAIGVKKAKVASQFIIEILMVTMMGLGVGAVIGAVSSVPVSNQLLSSQVSSATASASSSQQQFGRSMDASSSGSSGSNTSSMPSGGPSASDSTASKASSYVSTVNATVNLKVIAQLLGIGLALALLAGLVGIVFVMRYEPLQILAERS